MKVTVYILLVLGFAVDCSAQTLADVARRERNRQKQLHSVVVIANGVTTTTAASTSTTTAAPTPPAPAVPGVTDRQGHDEKYWRAKFQKARDDVKAAEEKVQILDLKVKDLNTQLLRQSDIYNREYRLGPEITNTQKQLDEARASVDQAKQKLSDLEDDLRRAGGPPGWAR